MIDRLLKIGYAVDEWFTIKKKDAKTKHVFCFYNILNFIDYGAVMFLALVLVISIVFINIVSMAIKMPFITIPLVVAAIGFLIWRKCNKDWTKRQKSTP